MAPLNILQFIFLVYINHHVPLNGFPQAGAFHFPRLEHHITIRQNRHRTPLLHIFDRIERVWKEAVGKRIIHQKVRDGQNPQIVRVIIPVTL